MPSGYSTLIVILCLLFAVMFWLIGLIGYYIGILFQEIKGRPIYIVKEVLESEDTDQSDQKEPEGDSEWDDTGIR